MEQEVPRSVGLTKSGRPVARRSAAVTRASLLLAATAAFACGSGGPEAGSEGRQAEAPPGEPAAARVDTVDIFLQEYVIDMPARLASGSILRVVNAGSEPHNLKIHLPGGDSVVWVSEDLNPGTSQIVTLVAAPGAYGVKCDLAGHDLRGMQARLEVEARRP